MKYKKYKLLRPTFSINLYFGFVVKTFWIDFYKTRYHFTLN